MAAPVFSGTVNDSSSIFPSIVPEDRLTLSRHDAEKTRVLIIKKVGDAEVTDKLVSVAEHLLARGASYSVYVEPAVLEQEQGAMPAGVVSWESGMADVGPFLSKAIDLIACLGGDGTLLHINSLFSCNPVPPCLCFN